MRQQLEEAQKNLQRQIDILRAGPASMGKGGAFIDNSGMIADLSNTLREIREGLANLGPDDA
jgi:hypothetical protein